MIPLFSVIVPLFNKEAYIVETLRSIMNQSCQDFELIVVDDCSTDNSLKLVKSLQIPNIRIIYHKTNKGLSATRNTGARQAKGELITMLDADDRWHHDFLSSIAKMVVDFPKASIFGTSDAKPLLMHADMALKVDPSYCPFMLGINSLVTFTIKIFFWTLDVFR